MATLLVPELFHADMAIPCFDPFQTSSPIFRVIWVSSAMSTLRMFGMTPFTSPCKAINRDIYNLYVPCGVFLRVQYWCQVSITLLWYLQR